MASVIGESGAWREIAQQLGRCGHQVQQPTDIDRLLTHLRGSFQPSVERKKSEIAQCVATKEHSIAALQAQRGIWRSFVNWFRIQGCKMSISHLHGEERQYIANLSENIREVDALQKSGTPLQSAQIDHVVLSSAGVFVIETKRWSRRFVESGEYHNPFDQIQRAAYLCYDQLRAEFGKIHVRSLIACAGQLPSAPEGSHVKVLAIPELVGYISWFRQPELAPDRLLQVRHYLERFRAS